MTLNTRFRPILLLLCITAEASWVSAQTIEDSILVPGAWVGSLAYNSREDVIYGASEQGFFFAISAESNRVISSYPLNGAFVVAYDSVDNKAYLTYHGTEVESLAVIDGVTHQVTKKLEMPGSTNPVWDPVSDRVYVSCQFSGQVAVVDCATDSILTYIPVGACPIKMYINTLRRKLYVLNYDAGSVSIVDMASNTLIRTVYVGGNPNAGHYCRSADKFYSAGPHEQCVVLGGFTDTIVARISLPGIEDVSGATGNESSGLVYLGVFTGHDDYVATVMAQEDSVTATALTGRDIWGLAYSSQSGLLYSASSWSDKVFVLTGDGARILRTLQVGDYPFVFAQAPRHRRLYLGHLGTSLVYVLRDTAAGIAEPEDPRVKPDEALVATPNPFSRELDICVRNADVQTSAVRVYSQSGSLVRVVRVASARGPSALCRWDGRDESGEALPGGVYVIEALGARVKVVKAR